MGLAADGDPVAFIEEQLPDAPPDMMNLGGTFSGGGFRPDNPVGLTDRIRPQKELPAFVVFRHLGGTLGGGAAQLLLGAIRPLAPPSEPFLEGGEGHVMSSEKRFCSET